MVSECKRDLIKSVIGVCLVIGSLIAFKMFGLREGAYLIWFSTIVTMIVGAGLMTRYISCVVRLNESRGIGRKPGRQGRLINPASSDRSDLNACSP